MEFKSYKNDVLKAMKDCKKEFCEGVGTLVVAEAQGLTPVLTGNLKRSVTYEVMSDNAGVNVGVTNSAPYAVVIEKGLSGHKAQPFLEPGAMKSVSKVTNIAENIYRKLGGA
ncbi:HK97 gp10 family phage protein [Desulfosporosinus metallidurans]|uniref:Uncharacterized protein n=1 Tax=Desulfosporosinus metallidurans TaxID=1888891 RepID=A0A1Q8QJN1_9FIRM|nr:HK97 gp10 family phage protein [Desulfosporosinus metallidurans]OLN27526.1 hypothetical protein DSOL_4498 [Desulfosporosinus metallidurans]